MVHAGYIVPVVARSGTCRWLYVRWPCSEVGGPIPPFFFEAVLNLNGLPVELGLWAVVVCVLRFSVAWAYP